MFKSRFRKFKPIRFDAPIFESAVTHGERDFSVWYKDVIGSQLVKPPGVGFDWYDPQNQVYYDVKSVECPRSHFGNEGDIRLNKISLENRFEEQRGSGGVGFVVLVFNDGQMEFASLLSVMSAAKVDAHDVFGDRPSLLVPIKTFRPIKQLVG